MRGRIMRMRNLFYVFLAALLIFVLQRIQSRVSYDTCKGNPKGRGWCEQESLEL